VLLVARYLSGRTSITGETMGQTIDDTKITTTVKSKLAVDKASSLARVSVEITRGVVQLTMNDKAAAVARSWMG